MFARKVAARLKPNSLQNFAELMEREILPWLRQQEGFLELMVLAASNGNEVTAISFWDHGDHARPYNSDAEPEVVKILGGLFEGTPHVKTFEVVGSTLQAMPFAPFAKLRNFTQVPQYDTHPG